MVLSLLALKLNLEPMKNTNWPGLGYMGHTPHGLKFGGKISAHRKIRALLPEKLGNAW